MQDTEADEEAGEGVLPELTAHHVLGASQVVDLKQGDDDLAEEGEREEEPRFLKSFGIGEFSMLNGEEGEGEEVGDDDPRHGVGW